MGKKALLIGLSTYQTLGYGALVSPALRNLKALNRVLQSNIGQFCESEIATLINPDSQQVRQAIEHLGSRCQPDDVRVLYFCGLGLIESQSQQLYLSAYDTQPNNLLSTAISSQFIQAVLDHSHSRNQLILIDCCWEQLPHLELPVIRSSTPEMPIIKLGGAHRAALCAFNPMEMGWPTTHGGLSDYTQALVEGIGTGLADTGADGYLSAYDLHQYVEDSLHRSATTTQLLLHAPQDSAHIHLFQLPEYQPEAEYRCSVEEYAAKDRGELSDQSRKVLSFLREHIGLSAETADAIESDVLKPYRERRERLQRYEQAFREATQLESPPRQSLRRWLKHLQQALELGYEDVTRIETRVISNQESHQPFQSRSHPVEETPATSPAVVPPSIELNHRS